MNTQTIFGMTFGQLSVVGHTVLALLIVSYLFNRVIESAGKSLEGWSWMLVVVGVFYTQIAIGMLDTVLDWNAFFIGILAYAASGSPMVRGAYLRHKDMQRRADKALRE